MTPEELAEVFAGLSPFEKRIPLPVLKHWMESDPLADLDFSDYRQFHPERYQRNLLHHGPAYHALLLCWQPGQRSPIHDHRGSSCAVRVVEGTATETYFDTTPGGMIYATRSRHRSPGEVTASQDADIHQISNLSNDNELVTLHVYSPPLFQMNMYSIEDTAVREFHDPVHEVHIAGSGI